MIHKILGFSASGDAREKTLGGGGKASAPKVLTVSVSVGEGVTGYSPS